MTVHAGCKGCCSFPHGMCRTLLCIFMAVASLGLSISVHATCFFVQGNDRFETGYGMWSKENVSGFGGYQCEEYTWAQTSLLKDTKWNAAAGCAFMAGLMGFIFAVFMIGMMCTAYSRAFLKMSAANYVLAGIFEFVTLVGVNSDICARMSADREIIDPATECVMSTGAILAIIAGICYFVMAVICFFFIPPATTDKEAADVDDKAKVTDSAAVGNDEGDEESNPDKGSDDDDDMEQQEVVDTSLPILDTASPVDNNASAIKQDIGNRGFWIIISDNLLFLLGSVFFMWLSVMDLQWAKTIQAWLDADLIDGNFDIRDNHLKDLANVEWTDDYVFQDRFHWVSVYSIVYFIAGLAFMVEGFLEFFSFPGLRGLWFTFAGATGLMAAWLSERDSNLSSIFSLISSHLFVVEAIGLLWNRSDFEGCLKHVARITDICFVIATTIDVVLSYTTLFQVFKMALFRTDTASAALWLFCSVVYIGLTLYAKYKGYFDKSSDGTQPEAKAADSANVPEQVKE